MLGSFYTRPFEAEKLKREILRRLGLCLHSDGSPNRVGAFMPCYPSVPNPGETIMSAGWPWLASLY
jgi:hypothetical protein